MLSKLINGLAAASLALVVAAPAFAAPWNGGKDLPDQIANLEKQVQDAQAGNLLSPRQATELQAEVSAAQQMHTKLSKGGIDRTEQRAIEQRILKVQQLIHRAAGKPTGDQG